MKENVYYVVETFFNLKTQKLSTYHFLSSQVSDTHVSCASNTCFRKDCFCLVPQKLYLVELQAKIRTNHQYVFLQTRKFLRLNCSLFVFLILHTFQPQKLPLLNIFMQKR